MAKGLAIGIIIVVLILIAVLIFSFSNFGNKSTTTTLPEIEEDETGSGIGTPPEVLNPREPSQTIPQTHTIEMSSIGFSPSTLTIKAGDTVKFLAVDNSDRWTASAVHPTHTVYPGSSISKCNTDERDEIFDACKTIPNGQSFSFTFTKIGTWNYHDHKDPSEKGVIVVE